VDDHDLFRSGLRALLEKEGFETAEAVNGEAALRRVAGFRPDVVVMDVSMPRMSGIEATREIRRTAPQTAVLMLTIIGDDQRVLEAVRAGASGYLLKDAELEEIVAGIRAAVRGHAALAPRVAGTLCAYVRRSADVPAGEVPAGRWTLSQREREVLTLLAEGYDNAEIGRQLFVSPSTVKNHVSRLLHKLGVENRVQAAAHAVRHGLVEGSSST
jgi:DNA-binding NarL/FixJ family response regulator